MKLKINLLCLLSLFLLSFSLQAQDAKKVEVQVNEKDGLKKITIRKHLEDGSLDVISWEGKGEIPEDIKKHFKEGNHMVFIKDDKTIEIIGGDDDSKDVEFIMKGKEDGKRMIFIGDDGKVIENDGKKDWIFISDDGKVTGKKGTQNIFIKEDGEKTEKEYEVILKGEDGEEGQHKIMKVVVEEGEEGDIEREVKVEVIIMGDGEHKMLKKKDKNVMVIRKIDGGNVEIKVDGEEVELKADEIEWTSENLPEVERTLDLENFSVAPNPAKNEVNLSFKAAKAPLSVRIFDQSGRQIYRAFIRDFDGLFQDSIDIRDVSADMLFITIEQEGKAYTEKVAVTK